jgi:Spy/CpxP family protein refolding chaperone
MQRLAPVILFVPIFILAGSLGATPAHAVDGKVTVAPTAAPKKEARAKAPIPGGPKDEKALWWDDPEIVKALSLTDEQRGKMGEYLKAYRKKVPQARRPETFQETLVQGDWAAARKESEKVVQSAAESVRMRGALKIDVLSLLSKEQREILVDRYPRLVYKPWTRAMRGAPPS